MNNSPFTIMKHEIIIAYYQSDMGYSFAIMVDEWHTTNPDIIRKWYTSTLDSFITFLADIYDWNAGDVVRIICCQDGDISINTVTVK